MKTRIIHTRMWEDEFFVKLSRNAKLLFIYLLTNQRINLIGCYEVSDRILMFDTGLTDEELKSAKKELDPKVQFLNEWVYIPKAIHLGGYLGPKIKTATLKEYETLPQYVIDTYKLDTLSIPYPYSIHTPINHKSEIINNKSEIINQKSEEREVDTEKGMERIKGILQDKGVLKKIGGEEALL